jgi:microcystin-dependent protein
MLNALKRAAARALDYAFVSGLTLAVALAPALGSQNSLVMPVTGTVSGVQLSNNITNALDSLLTCNLGPVAPTNQSNGTAEEGQCWIDTSGGRPFKKKYFSQSGWLNPAGYFDDSNLIWTPPIGGGEAVLVAAPTVDLGSVPQAAVRVDGNTTITSFGSSAVLGTLHYVRFTGTPQVTHNPASLIIPGGNPLVMSPGDVLVAKYEGGGNWRVVVPSLASGAPVALDPAGTVKAIASFNLPAGYLWANGQTVSRSTYANLFAAICVSQNGARTNGSNIITGLSSTANLGVGGPIDGTGIPSSTTVTSIDSGTQIHISANATSTGTNTLDYCPYGVGDGATTFAVPDLQGRALAGVGNMAGAGGGTGINGCANYTTLGTGCGSQTIAQNQLPNVSPSFTNPTYTFAGTAASPGTLFATNSNIGGAGVGSFQGAVQQGNFSWSSGGAGFAMPNFTPAGSVNLSGGGSVGSINGNVTQQSFVSPMRLMNFIIKY